MGYRDTARLDVIVPFYGHLLTAARLPGLELPRRSAVDERSSHERRADYQVAQASLSRLLALTDDDIHRDRSDPGALGTASLEVSDLREARNYIR